MARSNDHSAIPPGVRPGEAPAFHKMGEYPFQDLSAELLGEESGVTTSDVYGERGARQDGIDVRAYLADAHGTVVGQCVGQCKCYQDFPPAAIVKASEEFFAHWDGRWSTEPITVRRFILFVACDLHKRDRQDELERQRQRFEAFGIQYEWWSAKTIRQKLRPHPGIVRTYLKSDYWVEEI